MNRFFLIIFFSQSHFPLKTKLFTYSYFGAGDKGFTSAAENQMMGGLLVYYDSTHVNLNNAASLSKLKFVNYNLGIDIKSNSFKNNSINQKSTAAGLKYISVSIPTKVFLFHLD